MNTFQGRANLCSSTDPSHIYCRKQEILCKVILFFTLQTQLLPSNEICSFNHFSPYVFYTSIFVVYIYQLKLLILIQFSC